MRPRHLFDFRRQTYETKLRFLGRRGVTDVMCSPPLEPVSRTDWRPEGAHTQMWLSLLEMVFPETVGYNVELLEVLLSEDMESEELRKKLEAEVQQSVRRCGRHLFPIHCPETPEHVEGHWTLLSLERKGHESHVTVRYFETLDTMNEVCEARANKLLQICEVQESVSRRRNVSKQAGNDCVWWVLHYVEVEARMGHGEGLGGLPEHRPWPEEATHQTTPQAGCSAA